MTTLGRHSEKTKRCRNSLAPFLEAGSKDTERLQTTRRQRFRQCIDESRVATQQMRPIKQDRSHGLRRIGLLSPIFRVGALDVTQVDAVLGSYLRLAIAVSGQQQPIRKKP